MKNILLKTGALFSVLAMALIPTASAQALDLTGVGLQNGFVTGAFFQEIDPNNPAGTGVLDSFVRLQSPGNSTTEQGYNTDARPITSENNANNSPQFTRSLLLQNIPIVSLNGIDYRQFILDIDEPNSRNDVAGGKDLIDLTQLKIFLSNVGTLNNYPTGFGSPIYDLGNNVINLRDTNAGSGRADLLAYIPNSLFAGPNQYVYLYSQFTQAEGGFEEWAVDRGTPIPTPALLPGLIAMGANLLRKRRGGQEIEAEAEAEA